MPSVEVLTWGFRLGSPNANSRIIERLNAIAERRIGDGQTASWVVELRDEIFQFQQDDESWDDEALATYLALRNFSKVFPSAGMDAAVIQTDQDIVHWFDEVPPEIKADSGSIIRRMVLEQRHVTYAVQRDNSENAEWEVKVTLTSTFDEEPPRYSVTWVVPTVQLSGGTDEPGDVN